MNTNAETTARAALVAARVAARRHHQLHAHDGVS